MDTQQNLNDGEEIEALRLQNSKLKKDLEREQHLHSLLFKEWQELKERMTGKENKAYDSSRNKNSFYKYAFYSLLVILVPAFLILYFRSGNEDAGSQVQTTADSTQRSNPAAPATVAVIKDSLAKSDSIPAGKQQQAQSDNPVVVQQPVTPPAETKAIPQVNDKPPPPPVSKPEVEPRLTDEMRDLISSDGFSAYFEHRRNPYKKSSERYKIWQEGWNDGKLGAEAVEAKDPSLK